MLAAAMSKIEWKVHTSSLLREVLSNPGTAILTTPINIFGNLLAQVAERAAIINDPELNIMMLRLTLYEQADPDKFTATQIERHFARQRRRLKAAR